MKTFLYLFLLLFTGCCLWCCEKSAPYSEIPEIHFEKLVMKIDRQDALGEKLKVSNITFSFADGDGDLGVILNSGETISKIYYTWMKKQPDGQYDAHVFDTGATTDTLSIPYEDVMNKDEAYNKLLKGVMEIKLTVPYGPASAGMDTVRIEFFIVDRAAHKSNVDITPDFSILADSVSIEL